MNIPVKYDPVEWAPRIFERLAQGMTMDKACDDYGFPAPMTVWKWIASIDSVREAYWAAKCDAGFRMAEEILAIADDGRNDWMEINDPENPGWRFNGEHVNRSRLRIDTRKWLLAKLMPRRYGERVEFEGRVHYSLEQLILMAVAPAPADPE